MSTTAEYTFESLALGNKYTFKKATQEFSISMSEGVCIWFDKEDAKHFANFVKEMLRQYGES